MTINLEILNIYSLRGVSCNITFPPLGVNFVLHQPQTHKLICDMLPPCVEKSYCYLDWFYVSFH